MRLQTKVSSGKPESPLINLGFIIVAAVAVLSGFVCLSARLVGFVSFNETNLGIVESSTLLMSWTDFLIGGWEAGDETPAAVAQLPAPQWLIALVALVLFIIGAGLALMAHERLSSWRTGIRGPMRARNRREREAAHWGTRSDLRSILVRPGQASGRMVLGDLAAGVGSRRQVAVEELHSVFVLGPTQSRKTSGLCIPILLEWEGPAIVTSVKPDLLQATRLARWREGDVLVFDPAGLLGADGACWDVLAGVTSWQEARELARWLCEAAAEHKEIGDPTKGFFDRRGQRPLAAAIWAAALRGKTIGQVRRWLDELGAEAPGAPRGEITPARYNDAAEAILEILGDEDQEDAILALKSVLEETERQRSGSLTSAQDALDVFGDEHVERACSPDQADNRPRIDPDRLLDGLDTLYLYAPLHEQDRLRPVMEALIMSVVRTAMERTAATGQPLHPRLLVLLDEAGNVAPLRQLAQLASTGAGQGVQLVSVFQDFAQVVHRYGRQAATVVNNHRAKVLLSGLSDPDSLRYVSDLIGESAELERSHTDGDDRHSTTEHVAYRRLAPPALLRATRPGEGVVLYGHLPPGRLRLRWWEADKGLRLRAGPSDERGGVSGQDRGDSVRGDRRVVHLGRYRRRRRAS
jgi:type IV secretion system protein VirD4